MRFNHCLAALAATVAFASPAFAQTTDSDTAKARGTVLLPLSVTKDTDLDFGTVLASNTTAGWVEVSADDGKRSTDGTGVTLIALQPGGRATFTVTATASQTVDLTLTPPTGNVLNGPNGAQIEVEDFRLDNEVAGDLIATRVTGAGGTLLVGAGAKFIIKAAQPNGVYSADFTLTADYK